MGIFVNRRESIIKAIEVFEECGLKEKYKYKLDDDIETLNFNDIDKPTILTYHSSKGLQFDHVFVTCCDNNKIYATKDNDELNYRNSLFVACTRTKGRLYVTYCGTLNEL
ncbi:3'-5' exonuclease [Clostridium beijerinckii]|uniref:3'-5' exonuclease n=1 Tax=Clostridium beijerinckii TaxID=1520 RepID=UPI0015C8C981|nr:superfamily I DNA/RNA helicase [Clostridium beijerinckii]